MKKQNNHRTYTTASGKQRLVIDQNALRKSAEKQQATMKEQEEQALLQGILPLRVVRNCDTFSAEQQRKLLNTKVLLVGAGGLGGYVLEHLLRAGVGSVTVCDGDCFDETNLNRQLLCTQGDDTKLSGTIGRPKAAVAVERAAQIALAATVTGIEKNVGYDDCLKLGESCDIAIDAMGGPAQRLALQNAAQHLGIPLVSAAVSGWHIMAGTVMPRGNSTSPDDANSSQQGKEAARPVGIAHFMGSSQAAGTEETAGTIVSAVNMAACIQSAEALRILTGDTPSLDGKLLIANLATMEFNTMVLG